MVKTMHRLVRLHFVRTGTVRRHHGNETQYSLHALHFVAVSHSTMFFGRQQGTRAAFRILHRSRQNPPIRWHGGPAVAADAPTVHITFRHPDGETTSTVDAKVGESLLQTAHRYSLDLEGACEGGRELVHWPCLLLCVLTSDGFHFLLQSVHVVLAT